MFQRSTHCSPGIILSGLLLFVVAGRLPASPGGPYTPKPGSPERKVLMDTLRAPVERDLKMPVIFVVNHPDMNLRVERDWAFVCAQFRHPDGKPMGPSYFANGDNSDLVVALLHRVHGQWRVVTHDTGVSDVPWPGWPHQYHCPADLCPRVPM
jgi:hypothetical protein